MHNLRNAAFFNKEARETKKVDRVKNLMFMPSIHFEFAIESSYENHLTNYSSMQLLIAVCKFIDLLIFPMQKMCFRETTKFDEARDIAKRDARTINVY